VEKSPHSYHEKERLASGGRGFDKPKRVIIFLLEIESRMKGVIGYGMGTYHMEALQGTR
jgi:hypothetical protein